MVQSLSLEGGWWMDGHGGVSDHDAIEEKRKLMVGWYDML